MTSKDENNRNANIGICVPSVLTVLRGTTSDPETEEVASSYVPTATGTPRPVPVEFTSRGLTYRQVRRVNLIAIYSVHNRVGRIYGYEVVIIGNNWRRSRNRIPGSANPG